MSFATTLACCSLGSSHTGLLTIPQAQNHFSTSEALYLHFPVTGNVLPQESMWHTHYSVSVQTVFFQRHSTLTTLFKTMNSFTLSPCFVIGFVFFIEILTSFFFIFIFLAYLFYLFIY